MLWHQQWLIQLRVSLGQRVHGCSLGLIGLKRTQQCLIIGVVVRCAYMLEVNEMWPWGPVVTCSFICLYQHGSFSTLLGTTRTSSPPSFIVPAALWCITSLQMMPIGAQTFQKAEKKICSTCFTDVKMMPASIVNWWRRAECVKAAVCVWCALICSDLFLGVFVSLLMPWQDR